MSYHSFFAYNFFEFLCNSNLACQETNLILKKIIVLKLLLAALDQNHNHLQLKLDALLLSKSLSDKLKTVKLLLNCYF